MARRGHASVPAGPPGSDPEQGSVRSAWVPIAPVQEAPPAPRDVKRSFHPTGPGFEEDPAPRAFSEAALTPVYELNAFFLDLLTTLARDSSRQAWAWQAALQPELSRLTPAARARIARCPVCLVDAGFEDERRWTSPASDGGVCASAATLEVPLARSVELTQMTVMLAWSIARTRTEAACIIFGMS